MMQPNKYITFLLYPAFIFCLSLTILSCSSTRPQLKEEGPFQYDDDNKNIDEPEFSDPNLKWNATDRTAFTQINEAFDLERNLRNLIGNPEQAYNINSFDEVPDCSWFTNRHGLKRMTPEEIIKGRDLNPGPDTSGNWTVFRPKVGGATPGFWIEDIHGRRFIIKFDPKGYPEMATGAAAVGSRFFHAAGYNVPQETIVIWKPDKLVIKEGTTYKDKHGNKVPFTREVLNNILDSIEKDNSGYIRSLASFSLENVKGPFSYNGTRKDDPNDWCPHEFRRELRGLYVIASFVNHYDTKDLNSLDAFEEENGRKFLKHYLIDFGSCFGADGDSPKPPKKGYTNIIDIKDMVYSFFTLGLVVKPWEKAKPIQYSSIGYFESELFEPNNFDPIIPNPAFERMSDRDAYWGAKIVMAFRDHDLETLIQTGQYSNPDAAEYLLKTLIERRDKIGRYWFNKINPLDYFKTESTRDNLIISFDDLAVKYNIEKAENSKYTCSVKYKGKTLIKNRDMDNTKLIFSSTDLNILTAAFQSPESPEMTDNFVYKIELKTKRVGSNWSKPTNVWLWYNQIEDSFKLVGVEHLD